MKSIVSAICSAVRLPAPWSSSVAVSIARPCLPFGSCAAPARTIMRTLIDRLLVLADQHHLQAVGQLADLVGRERHRPRRQRPRRILARPFDSDCALASSLATACHCASLSAGCAAKHGGQPAEHAQHGDGLGDHIATLAA